MGDMADLARERALREWIDFDGVTPAGVLYETPVHITSCFEEGDECPKCDDGILVKRINSNTNKEFLGCSNFPECKESVS